ncbi:MAG: DedA family protein [Atopobiaceae bacterium]|jgi:membrane protein DedA with SNARE-associated domain
MEQEFMSFVSQFGYFAVGALIFLENIFPPIPSELILPLAGFFSSTGALWLPFAIVSATIGSLAGAYVLYGIGTLLDEERLSRLLASRPMRMLGFEQGDVESAFGWFHAKGKITVLICRCIPIVRSLISIPAGMTKMSLAQFSLFTFLGSAVWNTVLCTLGWWAGDAWESVSSGAGHVIDIVSVVVVVLILGVVALWVAKRVVPQFNHQTDADTAAENAADTASDTDATDTHK